MKDTEDIYKEAFYSKDKKRAIELYDEVILREPKYHRAWRYRGLCKAEIGFEMNDKNYVSQGIKEVELSIEMAEKEEIDTIGVESSLEKIYEKFASMRIL